MVKQAQRGPATWKVEDIKDHLKKKSLDASSMSIAQAKPGICILGRPVGPLAMNQYMVFCEVSKNSSSFVCLLGWLFVCFERGMNMHLLSLSLSLSLSCWSTTDCAFASSSSSSSSRIQGRLPLWILEQKLCLTLWTLLRRSSVLSAPVHVCLCLSMYVCGGGLPSLSPSLCVSYEDAHAHVAIC